MPPISSYYWLNKNKRPTTSKNVTKDMNKSGIALVGPTTSGTLDVKDLPLKTGTASVRRPGEKRIVGGPTGSGANVRSQWVGEGANKRYVEVPEPVKDAGKTPSPKPTANTGSEHPSKPTGAEPSKPSDGGQKLASDLANKKKQGEMTLNDFMAIAKASGKRNSYNRGYQMWKNYQATGKLPQHRVGPDK